MAKQRPKSKQWKFRLKYQNFTRFLAYKKNWELIFLRYTVISFNIIQVRTFSKMAILNNSKFYMYFNERVVTIPLPSDFEGLCWFQTNLPLAALPLRRLASLAVSELQLTAATPLWLFTERQSLPSWIEFNCLRSAAVGKAARLSIYWLDAACRLVIPLRQVTLAQLN